MTEIEQPGAELYEQIPYPDLSHSKTHPDRLATVARLLGMNPAPVDRCRVLELGCAAGGNLLPMAYALPESEFVGLDYARRQIAAGKEAVSAVGLDNLKLVTADIMDLPPDLGQYDYIIAHGVYSWVPAPVRDALLAACRRHLAPQGVVYLSLNVYPGWYHLNMVRDLMFFAARDETDPLERARRGREAVEFLAESLLEDDHPFAVFIVRYVQTVLQGVKDQGKGGDALLLHDELSEVNDPMYFHEFNRHIGAHGLQYMAEAEFAEVMPGRLGQDVADRLRKVSKSLEEVEQYLDFLHHRTFRQTLLCHKEIEVQRLLKPAVLHQVQVSARVKLAEDADDLPSEDSARFVGIDNSAFTTDHPLTKAAFMHLMQITPRAADFGALVRAAAIRLGIEPGTDLTGDVNVLATKLLKAYSYSSSLINLHSHLPPFVTTVSERPRASRVARYQVEHGDLVTSMRHERVTLDATTGLLLSKLDGTLSRDELLAWLVDQYEQGKVGPAKGQERVDDPGPLLTAELDKALASLANAALLVG